MSPCPYQMVLVPVAPYMAQPISPAALGVPMMQLAWAQQMPGMAPPSAECSYAVPPKHGALLGEQRVGLVLEGVPKAAGPAVSWPAVAAPEADDSTESDSAPASTVRGSWADADDASGPWARQFSSDSWQRQSSKAASACSSMESSWTSPSRSAGGSAAAEGQPQSRTISAARRLRRQRATERAGAFSHQDVPEAFTAEADGSDEAPPSGAEDEATRAKATAKPTPKWLPKQQDLLTQLAAGGEERQLAVSRMIGCVWPLSCEAVGCRVVQLALEQASSSEAEALVAELHGHVVEATQSPHANYVIQKVIQTMPAEGASFVAEELAGFAGRTARHRFGCRIFCRLMEQRHEEGSAAAALISECLQDVEDLCRHPFGHYVVKAILEHGTEAQRHRIVQAIRSGSKSGQGQRLANGLMRNALHRNAGYVLEQCLEHCSTEDKNALARELLSDDSMAALGQSPKGSHVVKARIGHIVEAMLRVPDIEPAILARLGANAEALQTTQIETQLQ